MTTKWQEAAVEDAARRFPKTGLGKDDRDIWISMRDEAVARLPVGEKALEGWIRINVLGTLEVPKKPLVSAIMTMDDENFEYNMNGRYVFHPEAGKTDFIQSGNSFGPDIEHLMLSIDCDAFIDKDRLNELGGGVPASSELSDARIDAKDCGEDPDDWVAEMMKVAEENISASLRSSILFDDEPSYYQECFDAVLINYREAE